MRFHRFIPVVALAGLMVVGCSDDDPTGPEIDDFQGEWSASTIQYTAHADASRNLNIVPLGGGLELSIDNAGDFEGTFTLPGEPSIDITGSVTLVGEEEADIDFNWPSGVTPPITDFRATYTLQGDNLTFTREETVFQFPGQGAPEDASLVIIMDRD